MRPTSIKGCIQTLRDAGFEPYVVMSKEDAATILQAGGIPWQGRVHFTPRRSSAIHMFARNSVA